MPAWKDVIATETGRVHLPPKRNKQPPTFECHSCDIQMLEEGDKWKKVVKKPETDREKSP